MEYPEKTPDSLPTNRYYILEGKIQCPRWDLLEPSPSGIGNKLAWPRACTASDPTTCNLVMLHAGLTTTQKEMESKTHQIRYSKARVDFLQVV